MKFLFLTVFLIPYLSAARPQKVLVFLPITGHSHLKFMVTASSILQNHGYNVTLLMPTIDEHLRNTTKIIEKIKHRIILDIDPRVEKIIEENGGKNARQKTWTIASKIQGFLSVKDMLVNLYRYSCHDLFHNSKLLQELKKEEFDIGLSEPFFVCGFALFDHLGIEKMISIDSHIGLEGPKMAHGDPIIASFFPSAFSGGSDKMTFLERAENVFEMFLNRYFSFLIYNAEMEEIQDVYQNGKTWNELLRLNSYFFVNSNPIIDFPSPRISKFIDIGGIATDEFDKSSTILSKKYDDILSVKRQNVLISFGSNAKSVYMPEQMKIALIRTFESFPDVTFIWKYENTSVDIVKQFNPKIENVILTEWMPQTALLADPRLDLFITHGGLGSTNEVVSSGKPVVMVPIFGDQTRNARMLERHGMAVLLKKRDLLDSESIRNAIQIVLNNKSYSENAQKLARMIRDQPYSPKDVFLKYFNFVARHGKPNGIDSNAVNIGAIQYYFLDLIAFIGVFLVFSLFIVYQIFKRIMSLLVRKVKSE